MGNYKQLSNRLVRSILERDNHLCHYCGTPLWNIREPLKDERGITHHVYHIAQHKPTVLLSTETEAGERSFLSLPAGYSVATIDHKTPKVRGGTNHPDNLVACCSACNCSKNDSRTYEEFKAMKEGGAA